MIMAISNSATDLITEKILEIDWSIILRDNFIGSRLVTLSNFQLRTLHAWLETHMIYAIHDRVGDMPWLTHLHMGKILEP